MTRKERQQSGSVCNLHVRYESKTCPHDLTDHLGSIVDIANSANRRVFSATYDAWGKQTVTKDEIGFHRGYTGHEMLPDFGLINMNGRLYDPVIGRFLSTDNFVQEPSNSQNSNRYSYCLNNPLKYTDPSGEWFGIDDLLIAGIGFTVGYASSVISSGNWGWSSVKSGLSTSVMSWLGYNTSGLATGAINSSTWNAVASTGINTLVNSVVPPISVPIGNFGLSLSPALGFGEGGLNIGINSGLFYSDGDWHFGITAGIGSTYQGWYAEAGNGKFSAGYGATYYNSTSIGDYTVGRQIVGTGKLSWGDYSLSVSNDLFAESQDRWRTSAVEIGIGNYLVGTSVFTNWGAEESPLIDNKRTMGVNDHIVGRHTKDTPNEIIGSWRNGQVLSAPLWVGYKNGNQAYRVGGSAKIIQSLTQNLVHKFMRTPYFIHYNNFKSGAFSYYGYYNPLTLWNN